MMKLKSLTLFIFFLSLLQEVQATTELRWRNTTADNNLVMELQPRIKKIPIGRFHEWIIKLHDGDGQPINNAIIGINGGMPNHGHGLPSQPMVTKRIGNGQYLIEGVKFSMAGDWILLFAVKNASTEYRLKIKVTVTY